MVTDLLVKSVKCFSLSTIGLAYNKHYIGGLKGYLESRSINIPSLRICIGAREGWNLKSAKELRSTTLWREPRSKGMEGIFYFDKSSFILVLVEGPHDG